MYAPLPAAFPVGSTATWPAGVRTTLISSRFGREALQPVHMRSGTFRFLSNSNPPRDLLLGLSVGDRAGLALALDVDLQPGELGRQARVLALLADGQGQLVVRHDDARHAAVFFYGD